MKKSYRFVSDPGHGWAGVPEKDVQELGLRREISKYSYHDVTNGIIWLEEDSDLSRFMEKAGEAGWKVALVEEIVNDDAFVRRLPRLS